MQNIQSDASPSAHDDLTRLCKINSPLSMAALRLITSTVCDPRAAPTVRLRGAKMIQDLIFQVNAMEHKNRQPDTRSGITSLTDEELERVVREGLKKSPNGKLEQEGQHLTESEAQENVI